ncbi:MAG: hypothetical protein JW963_05845 [Anaerolineales bacterium]|nr:hypothetical protein [Anaerolineales bacterium]
MRYRTLFTSFTLSLMSLMLVSGMVAAQGNNEKVTICHIPSGNPANAHTITVSANALDAHLAHGDTQGPCPATSLDTTTETTNVEGVSAYIEVVGLVQNYRADTGIFELDGIIIIIAERPDFELTDGLTVYVRGFQLFDGRILAIEISQSASLLDDGFDIITDVVPPILLDVTGMITSYDQVLGAITLDYTIVVLLVDQTDVLLEHGRFVTVSGELLPDGRILADIVVLFDTNVDIDFDTADQKATICHVPPGNPDNAHSISISASAIPAHMGHGDRVGPCDGTDATGVITCGDRGCDTVIVTLVDNFGVTYDEVELLRAQGYGAGEIARVYLLSAAAGVPPQEIIDKRNSGIGWGHIMRDYPIVDPSELAPGFTIGDGRGHSVRNEEDGPPGRGNGNGNGKDNGNEKGNGNGKGNGKGLLTMELPLEHRDRYNL